MNILVVYAHHEPSSFTSAMNNVVIEELSLQKHTIALSDLYGQGFNPVAEKWDFTVLRGGHFNYMLEQKSSANNDLAFSPDIVGEIQKLQAADLIVFVAPIWWFGVPAIMKGWFDRVLAMGVAWDGGRIYEAGLLKGKQAVMVVNGGHPAEYYHESAQHKMSAIQMLHTINHGVLAFCGMNVHEPFVALNVLSEDTSQREAQLQELRFRIQNIFTSPNWLISHN